MGPLALGCAVESGPDAAETGQALVGDSFANPTGRHRTVSVDGRPIAENNGFFQSLGTNGRACVNCHQPAAAMGITPVQIRQVFDATAGLDPVFRLNDGANGPLARVSTLDDRRRAYSLLRDKALIRIPINLPAARDFDVRVVLNPYANTGANPPQNATVPAGASPELSFYRRPLLSANTRFISAVMWDGREATVSAVATQPGSGQRVGAFQVGAPVRTNMLTQSNNATLGHAQGAVNLNDAQRASITDFQMNIVVAQESDNVAGPLNAAGATGGPQPLRTQETFFGINDSHGGNPIPNTAFNPAAMNVFTQWANATGTNAQANRRRSIARGQNVFNSRVIRISGVRGVNDALGVATLNGSCTTCHSHPNVGNHTDILPLDVGISNPGEGDNVLPVFRVTSRATGVSEETTDLGRAAISGRFADLNKQKGPTLRALSARPPYFHNGAADTIDEVISFYDRRFHIGFTSQERADLKAFLEAL